MLIALVITSLAAPNAAAPNGASAANLNASLVGCTMINTPQNPIIIAVHLCQLTVSFRTTIPSMVVRTGAINAIAIASASGKKLRPVTKKTVDPVIVPALKKWLLQELIFKALRLFIKNKKTIKSIKIESPRSAITWPTGYD